jgi:glycosyltransferase involved in cell wall biosynthesis
MKLAIVTDAWSPQVNGVVTTLTRTKECIELLGHEVRMISPEGFRTLPCPTYREIRLALFPRSRVANAIEALRPDFIHIATEGPLGSAARAYCVRNGLSFTTSYHTQFPQYIRKRAPIPVAWSYSYLRRHHGFGTRTMVATEHQRRDLLERRFRNVVIWSRGVDTQLFRPELRVEGEFARPVWICVGRVAVEKNLEDFLRLELPGTKVVIGDGPDRAALAAKYPTAVFRGYRFGEDLASDLASADVFVFPSRTDTFGLVMLEAMACGTPVAAYPVTGPIDVVRDGITGCLDTDLRAAATAALKLSREVTRAAALEHTWAKATDQFLSHLVRADGARASGVATAA